MSRWDVEFRSHSFRTGWEAIRTKARDLFVDDQTITTDVEELARLTRVVEYLSGIIEGIDPELTPRSVWDQAQSQIQPCFQELLNYESSRNVAYLNNANNNLDNLLTYIRPYMVLPEQVMVSIRRASEGLTGAIEARMREFEQVAFDGLTNLRRLTTDISSHQEQLAHLSAQAEDFRGRVFGEAGAEQDGLQSRLDVLKANADSRSEAIDDLFERLVRQEEGDGTLESKLLQCEAQGKDLVAQIERNRTIVLSRLTELRGYHEKIFGKPEVDGEPAVVGLKAEIDARLSSMEELTLENDGKFKILFGKIESLLPGATSAGLASAYKDMRESFDGRIAMYTKLFYAALAGVFVAGIFSVISDVQLWPMRLTLVQPPGWQEMLRLVLYKAPLFIPVVWLAVFSSTRRSQYERLHQEYAHKETLAKSYESYKLQLEQLGQATDALRSNLIAKMIDAVSFNASETLDRNHREKFPIEGLLQKLSLEDLKKLAELAKDKVPRS